MRKIKKIIITFLVTILGFSIMPDIPVYASGAVSVSVSASSVNIGDAVTVTATPKGPNGEAVNAFLTFTFDSSKFSFVSCSEGNNYGGGAGGTVTVTGVESASITLKATSAGSASVSVSGTDLVASADGTTEFGEASAGGTTITVNNAAAPSTTPSNPTENNTTSQPQKALSGDNSLKTLAISPGTLSPAFKYNTTNYTASVGADVKNIVVSAETSNENATIVSVTGNENLVEGNNAIKIVVKAENGVTATYTITVKKGGATTETPNSEAESEEPESEEEPTSESEAVSGIVVNEIAYTISEDFKEEEIPEDFSVAPVMYQGMEYQGLVFDKSDVEMLYLVPAEGEQEGKFFVYDKNQGTFYSYVRMTFGEKYIIALLPEAGLTIPEQYAQTKLDLGEAGTILAYQEVREDETISEFFLFYAVNSDGTKGWYQYDSLEGTFQRWNGMFQEDEQEEVTDSELLQKQFADLTEQYSKEKAKARKLLAVFFIICVILIIVIINLVLRGGSKDELEDLEEENEEDEFRADVLELNEQKEPEKEKKPMQDDFSDDEFMKELEEKTTKKKTKNNKKTDAEEDDIEILDLNDL